MTIADQRPFMGTPPHRIDTTRLVLRAWSVDDAPLLRAAMQASATELQRWIPWVLEGTDTDAHAAERIARHVASFGSGAEWLYGIFDIEETHVLGGCGLHPRIGPGGVEIGYWVASPHAARGIATEAARALTEVALAMNGVDRVEIRCDPANVASARIPARLGFTHVETIAGDTSSRDGKPRDLMVWRMTRP